MKTISCTIEVETRDIPTDEEFRSGEGEIVVEEFTADELRYDSEVEVDRHARIFALRAIRNRNKALKKGARGKELVRVLDIKNVVECQPSCETCVHKIKAPTANPCSKCNPFYDKWK